MLFSQSVSSASISSVCTLLAIEREASRNIIVELHSGRVSAAESDEINPSGVHNNSSLVAHVQQSPHGFPPVWSIIQRALVHIHANEFICELGIKIVGELQCVG